ncbi:MAG: hypothetical protein ABSA44_09735 [Bacteroidota bacterium]|jgi:hypothetical protein
MDAYSRQDVIGMINNFVNREGRIPMQHEFLSVNGLPGRSVLARNTNNIADRPVPGEATRFTTI